MSLSMKHLAFFFVSFLVWGTQAASELELKSLLHQNETTIPHNSDAVYVDCAPTDLMLGSELRSVVNYVFHHLDINAHSNDSAENYRFWCTALERKLGGGDPYDRVKTISTTSTSKVLQELKNLLPNKNLNISQDNGIVEVVTDSSNTVDDLKQLEHPGHLNLREDKKADVTDLSVIKVFRNGEDLAFVPCYLSIRSKKKVVGSRFRQTKAEETVIRYNQRKYVLSTFDIGKIVEKIKKNNL